MMWIVSRNRDLLTIIFPSIFILFLAYFIEFNIEYLWILFILYFLSDDGHIISTVFRITRDNIKERPFWLGVFPLLVFIVLFSGAYLNFIYLATLIVILEIFHVMRQHQGFVKLYHRKGSQKGFYYSFKEWFTLFFLIFLNIIIFFKPGFNVDFIININKDQNLFNYAMLFLSSCFIVFLLYDIFSKRFNKASLYMVSILLSHLLAYFFFDNIISILIVAVLSHGIPYFSLIIYSKRKQWNPLLILFYSLFYAFFIHYGVHEYIINNEKDYLVIMEKGNLLLSLLTAFYFTPVVFHYIIDGLLWKKDFLKENKYL